MRGRICCTRRCSRNSPPTGGKVRRRSAALPNAEFPLRFRKPADEIAVDIEPGKRLDREITRRRGGSPQRITDRSPLNSNGQANASFDHRPLRLAYRHPKTAMKAETPKDQSHGRRGPLPGMVFTRAGGRGRESQSRGQKLHGARSDEDERPSTPQPSEPCKLNFHTPAGDSKSEAGDLRRDRVVATVR